MNEINHALRSAPIPCRDCDFSLPATKNYRTGALTYPALPDGLCDECRDYREQHSPIDHYAGCFRTAETANYDDWSFIG